MQTDFNDPNTFKLPFMAFACDVYAEPLVGSDLLTPDAAEYLQTIIDVARKKQNTQMKSKSTNVSPLSMFVMAESTPPRNDFVFPDPVIEEAAQLHTYGRVIHALQGNLDLKGMRLAAPSKGDTPAKHRAYFAFAGVIGRQIGAPKDKRADNIAVNAAITDLERMTQTPFAIKVPGLKCNVMKLIRSARELEKATNAQLTFTC